MTFMIAQYLVSQGRSPVQDDHDEGEGSEGPCPV